MIIFFLIKTYYLLKEFVTSNFLVYNPQIIIIFFYETNISYVDH